MENYLPNIKLEKMKRCIYSIEQRYKDEPEKLKDIELSFEYIIGSFFPKVLDNIKQEMSRQYIAGYNEGFKDGSKDK